MISTLIGVENPPFRMHVDVLNGCRKWDILRSHYLGDDRTPELMRCAMVVDHKTAKFWDSVKLDFCGVVPARMEV